MIIASGTYGVVFRAQMCDENNNERVVALKKIRMGNYKDGGTQS
jgi:hypothetical protein